MRLNKTNSSYLNAAFYLTFQILLKEEKKKYNGIHEEFFVKGELEYSFVSITVVCFLNFYGYQSKHEHGSEDSIRIVQKDL